jgi:hypothetical protein
MIPYIYNDGGRAAAGYKGHTGDCVCRAIAIAAELPYQQVYDTLNELAKERKARKSAARTGVARKVYDVYIRSLGMTWRPTMAIGSGCRVHLRASELPAGRIICRLSRHIVAVVDGVLHDTYDCSREGDRCVYGYYARG